MTHSELPADVAGSDTELSKLHDPKSHVVRERPTVDKDPAKLVDFTIRVDMRLHDSSQSEARVRLTKSVDGAAPSTLAPRTTNFTECSISHSVLCARRI